MFPHCPCPPASDFGSRVCGLVYSHFVCYFVCLSVFFSHCPYSLLICLSPPSDIRSFHHSFHLTYLHFFFPSLRPSFSFSFLPLFSLASLPILLFLLSSSILSYILILFLSYLLSFFALSSEHFSNVVTLIKASLCLILMIQQISFIHYSAHSFFSYFIIFQYLCLIFSSYPLRICLSIFRVFSPHCFLSHIPDLQEYLSVCLCVSLSPLGCV